MSGLSEDVIREFYCILNSVFGYEGMAKGLIYLKFTEIKFPHISPQISEDNCRPNSHPHLEKCAHGYISYVTNWYKLGGTLSFSFLYYPLKTHKKRDNFCIFSLAVAERYIRPSGTHNTTESLGNLLRHVNSYHYQVIMANFLKNPILGLIGSNKMYLQDLAIRVK